MNNTTNSSENGSALQVFDYNGAKVRTVEINGEVWFVAKDVCSILGLTNTAEALRGLNAKDLTSAILTSGGQNREMNCINEPGVYKLIFKSRKPEAEKFQDWVTSEVLPAIRKHGMYISDKNLDAFKDNPEAFNLLLEKYTKEHDKRIALQEQIAIDLPYTVLGKVMTARVGSFSIQNAAHFLSQHGVETGQNRLYKRFREDGWLCSRKGKQYNKPTQRAIDKGFFNVELGSGMNVITVITPEGLKFFSNLFLNETYPLLVAIQNADCDGE